MVKNQIFNLNLFKGYTKEENIHSHALISIIKFLYINHYEAFKKVITELEIIEDFKGVNRDNIEFDCQTQGLTKGTYDLVLKIDKNLFPIEAKLKARNQNLSHYKNLKRGQKLIYLTNFTKQELINHNPLIKKNVKRTRFINWNDIYKALQKIDIKGAASKYIINEFINFSRGVNYYKSGIIQKLNYEYGDDNYIDRFFTKKEGWHLPERISTLDIPEFTVFIYDRYYGGIIGYFISKGLIYDKARKNKYGGRFEYEFDIRNRIDLRKKPLLTKDFKKILSNKDISNKNDLITFKSDWSKPGKSRWQYKFLNYDQVQTLKNHIEKN